MSQPDTEQCRAESAPEAAGAQIGTRVDPPHVAATQGAGSPAAGQDAAPPPAQPSAIAERLRVQAEQLAAHLRARQQELDHRQSQINANMAQLDCDTRAARLWLMEREAELKERAEGLAGQEGEVQARLERLAAVEAALRQRPETDADAGADSARQQAEAALCYEQQQVEAGRQSAAQLVRQLMANVERRREAVEARALTIEQQQAEADRQLRAREEVLRRTAEGLEARGRQIEQAEGRLADAHAETQQLGQQLLQERREVQEEGRVQRERLAAEQREAAEELAKKRQAVQRRAEHVDHCRLALQQLRAELGRMHRETLEIRLATEELWVQLSGAAPPAALTHSLGRIRSKLAEHYRLANAELQQQKAELEGIRSQLAKQYEKLVQQKRLFDQWAAAHRAEAQQQAECLIARERQLQEQETDFHDRSHRWQAERLEFQHEIRCLQSRLPQQAEAAVSA